jgi:SAM-dependent methyltransferase
MGLYNDRVLPRLLDLVMGNRMLDSYRRGAVGDAGGTILEIGIGSGLNLPHYGRQADRIIGLDPSARLLSLAAGRVRSGGRDAALIRGTAQSLPLPDDSVDAVVTTWSLCSIDDPLAALGEMRRVLRPGGRLHFVEHGLGPTPLVRRVQNGLTPCWRHMAGGCHLNRRIDALIRDAGFRIGALEAGYMPGPRFLAYLYRGWADTGKNARNGSLT